MLEALTAARENEVVVRQPLSTKDIVEGGRDARSGQHDATSEVIGVRVVIARALEVERTSQEVPGPPRVGGSGQTWTDRGHLSSSLHFCRCLSLSLPGSRADACALSPPSLLSTPTLRLPCPMAMADKMKITAHFRSCCPPLRLRFPGIGHPSAVVVFRSRAPPPDLHRARLHSSAFRIPRRRRRPRRCRWPSPSRLRGHVRRATHGRRRCIKLRVHRGAAHPERAPPTGSRPTGIPRQRIRFLPLQDPRPPLRPEYHAARAAYLSRRPLRQARPPAIAWTSRFEFLHAMRLNPHGPRVARRTSPPYSRARCSYAGR
jgi:hypothetical protein